MTSQRAHHPKNNQDPVTRVVHLGNTANNAYYNSEILALTLEGEVDQAIFEFGLVHAISAPVWETLEFEVPYPQWVHDPDWSEVPGAEVANESVSEFSAHTKGPLSLPVKLLSRVIRGLFFRLDRLLWKRFGTLGPSWTSGIGLQLLSGPKTSSEVIIVYGPNFIRTIKLRQNRNPITIAFEHGTFRWAGSPPQGFDDLRAQKRYLSEISKCDFALVTNLDPQSIAAAKEIFNDRWVAIPHPYTPNSEAPYEADSKVRQELLAITQSEFIIILGSSHNSSKFHDKGTNHALEGFKALRDWGEPVGLVTIDWGLEAEDSRRKMREWGLGSFVHWVSPLPRKNLQMLAASCDISWNQFGYNGIGAFDLRMLEQGLPHVSAGIDSFGESLIGSKTPWYAAKSSAEIFQVTRSILEDSRKFGRRKVMLAHQEKYRRWIQTYHSPALTGQIQKQCLEIVRDSRSGDLYLDPALWRQNVVRD